MSALPSTTTKPALIDTTRVLELQKLLNVRGFGPVAEDGKVSSDLTAAVKALGVHVPSELTTVQINEAITALSTMVVSQQAAAAVEPVPFWKTGKFWGIAAAVGAVGYVAMRMGVFEDEPTTTVSEPEAVAGLAQPVAPKQTRAKRKREKCDVLPNFDEAEPVTADLAELNGE